MTDLLALRAVYRELMRAGRYRDAEPLYDAMTEIQLARQQLGMARSVPLPLPGDPRPATAECVGHGRGGTGRCCDRAGEYNGYGSDGPWLFVCPKSCSCHD